MYKEYWAFYWPLALTQIALILIYQVFNGILARYPNAEQELAAFAIASSTYMLAQVGTLFISQLVVVYGRSAGSRKKVFRFSLSVGALFVLPLLILGASTPGTAVLTFTYGIDGRVLEDVIRYLLLLSPLVIFRALLNFVNGLLTLSKRTKAISLASLIGVGVSIAVAVYGFSQGWSAVVTLVAAQQIATLVPLVIASAIFLRSCEPVNEPDFEEPSYSDLLEFFWPVSLSGLSFGASRPIIYAFAARTSEPLIMIAALRVAFDFFMLAQVAANQFRSFLPTFGLEELARKRAFMGVAALILSGALVICSLPPFNAWIFGDLLGLEGKVINRVCSALWVLAVAPLVITARNYFHGILMVNKMTRSMALGSLLRVVAIALAAVLLLQLGYLNSNTGAFLLLLGFVVETGIVLARVRTLVSNPNSSAIG